MFPVVDNWRFWPKFRAIFFCSLESDFHQAVSWDGYQCVASAVDHSPIVRGLGDVGSVCQPDAPFEHEFTAKKSPDISGGFGKKPVQLRQCVVVDCCEL